MRTWAEQKQRWDEKSQVSCHSLWWKQFRYSRFPDCKQPARAREGGYTGSMRAWNVKKGMASGGGICDTWCFLRSSRQEARSQTRNASQLSLLEQGKGATGVGCDSKKCHDGGRNL